MRLIDELLKDDFFHGGFQPAVAPATIQAASKVPAQSGSKKPIILIAAAVGGLAVIGAGAFFFLKGGKPQQAPQAAVAKAPAVVPAPQAAPAAAAPAAPAEATPAAAPVAAVPANVTPATATPPAPAAAVAGTPSETAKPSAVVAAPAAPVQAAKPAEVAAPAAKPAPVAEAKPVAPDYYTLVFPKYSDKAQAEAVIAKLKASGATPKLITGGEKTTAYRVASAKNATAAESNAIKLKASIFKVNATPVPQADGSVLFDLGVFATQSDAAAAVESAKKLAHEMKITEEQKSVPVYSIDAGKWPEEEAKSKLSALAADGAGVKVKKVK
jgi:hypothetical protein